MDLYYLPALAIFGAIAATAAVAYFACANLIAGLATVYHRRRRRGRMSRPGEAVRTVLGETDARLRRHSTALLLFVVCGLVLSVFGERGWWYDVPMRLCAVLLVGLAVLLAFAVARLQQLSVYRWRLLRLLDMHEDLAVRLSEAQMRGNRVHYAVPAGATCIDTVVTGPNGVYALRILPPPADADSVRLAGEQLHFEPGGQRFGLARTLASSRTLAKEINQATGVRCLVQPVVIVPGCRILDSEDGRCLVVNHETCVSFVGWRNASAFLMEEETASIDNWLGGQTITRDRAARRAAAATLGNAIPPPALV